MNEDLPDHLERRRLITPPFLPAAVAKLEPHIREYTNDYLDRIVKLGSADLVKDFVWEIPVRVLFKVMGIPDADANYVKEFTAERALFTWGRPSEEKQREMAGEVGVFAQYCEKHVARLREQLGDDITSAFIRASDENPELFTELMVHSYLINFMFAGHETTTSGAASTFLNLLQHREQWEAVCADPSLIPNTVEEVLRYSPPLIAWHRRALEPATVGGVEIPVGARLLLHIGSANRDEAGLRGRRDLQHPSQGCAQAPVVRLRQPHVPRRDHRPDGDEDLPRGADPPTAAPAAGAGPEAHLQPERQLPRPRRSSSHGTPPKTPSPPTVPDAGSGTVRRPSDRKEHPWASSDRPKTPRTSRCDLGAHG